MAAAFARRALGARESSVTVSSSGLLPGGRVAPDEVVTVMAERGIDLAEHRSRQFDADVIGTADLILGMERRHLTEIVAIDAEAYRKTFTLPEFVHRLETLVVDDLSARSLAEVLDLIAEDRGRRDLLRVTINQEIPDPMGHPMKFFNRVAAEIEGLVETMIGALWPREASATTGRV